MVTQGKVVERESPEIGGKVVIPGVERSWGSWYGPRWLLGVGDVAYGHFVYSCTARFNYTVFYIHRCFSQVKSRIRKHKIYSHSNNSQIHQFCGSKFPLSKQVL